METVKYFDNFRHNVKVAMELQGLSVRSLAGVIGTSPAYISNLLQGKNVPSIDRCEEISVAVSVPLERLLADPKTQKIAS
jgi:transcriptional regulator with XRE-family HTH domain